eukprot:1190906-Prorocentrum_minimum.AAC.1
MSASSAKFRRAGRENTTEYDQRLLLLLHFTGPPVPITARMHSTPQRPFQNCGGETAERHRPGAHECGEHPHFVLGAERGGQALQPHKRLPTHLPRVARAHHLPEGVEFRDGEGGLRDGEGGLRDGMGGLVK